MAVFKFQQSDGLVFNPLTNQGTSVVIERDVAQDKAQVNLGFVQTIGSRIKISDSFDKTPSIIFASGEFTKTVNLIGIVEELQNPNSIKIRINDVSEGDRYGNPSEVVVKLTNKPINSRESIKVAAKATVITANTDNSTSASDITDIKKMLTGLSGDIKKVSTRLSVIEKQEVDDAYRDQQSMESINEVSADTNETVAMLQELINKLGSTTTTTPTPTPRPTPVPTPVTNESIAQVVLQVLQQAGIVNTPTTADTATVIYGGKQFTVPVTGTKPTCDPIVTTSTIITPVEPALSLVYAPCATTPIVPSVCGNYTMPIMAAFENGWRNTVDVQPFPNSNYEKTGYYRDGQRIFLMGNVSGGPDQLESSNKTKTIFRIPASCAPKTLQTFSVSGRTSNGGIESVDLIIYPMPDGSAIVYAQNEGIMPQTIAIVGNYLLAA